MPQYLLCGKSLYSDIALPELDSLPSGYHGDSEFQFHHGEVKSFAEPSYNVGNLEAEGRDRIIVHVPSIGRLLIEHGRRIVIDVSADADPERVRLNLIGSVQSILWLQRGFFPLHASTLQVDGKAIAVAGASRSGKSVAAAALMALGYPLLADDLTLVDTSENSPSVLPGYQKLRLFADAYQAFDLADRKIARAHPAFDKAVLSNDQPPLADNAVLSDVFILVGRRIGPTSIERMAPTNAVAGLIAAMVMREAGVALKRQQQMLHAAAAIASGARIWRVMQSDQMSDIHDSVRRFVACVGEHNALAHQP